MSCNEDSVRQFLRQSRKISDDKVASLLSDRNCNQQIGPVLAEWAKRAEILAKCAKITTNPDQDDDVKIAALWTHARDYIELPETKTNPRIDSYAARDEASVDTQMNPWVRRELMAEEVVRDTTDGFFKQRCGFSVSSRSAQ